MTEDNKQDSHTGLVAGIAAALAAGAVYFYGPDGEKRRESLRGWMLKAKGEILDRLEQAEEVSRERYEEIVDTAIAKFAEKRAVKEAQVEKLRTELKGEWEAIKREAKTVGKEVREAAAERINRAADDVASADE